MGELKHIIKLNDEQLETLMTTGSVTVGEITVTLDLYGLYLTADEDKYVLYSSTGTVTTATPSAGTDAVNLDYFNANKPTEKKRYKHSMFVTFTKDNSVPSIEWEVIDSSLLPKTANDFMSSNFDYSGDIIEENEMGPTIKRVRFRFEEVTSDNGVVAYCDNEGYVGIYSCHIFIDNVTEI